MQVRQMGVLEAWRGQGLGALALEHLLRASVRTWEARTGWLQAREAAIEFYSRMGWKTFDAPYNIEGVGLHRSMQRSLVGLFD
jgi:predicted GNAT family N-acyltransferase